MSQLADAHHRPSRCQPLTSLRPAQQPAAEVSTAQWPCSPSRESECHNVAPTEINFCSFTAEKNPNV